VSPSKRAGDTVDSDRDPSGANGNGSQGNGHGAGPSDNGGDTGDGSTRARPRRRSVVSPSSAPAPERGSSSARGASSSSITKRSMTGRPETLPEDTEAPAAPAVVPEPVVEATIEPAAPEAPTALPATAGAETEPAIAMPPAMPPPGARVDPNARRPVSGEHSVVPTPLPVAIPSGQPAAPPAERTGTEVAAPNVPMAPPDPPYVTSTMSAHQVAPVPRLLGRRPRVRRVTRVVRHVDPWSVFKVALVFNLILYIVLLTAGVLLWNVAYATGTVDNLERFFESFGWSNFEFHGGAIYHASWIAGLFGVIGLTGAIVLAATLFNLITDLVGGIRMTVLEEEVQERTMAPMRRFVVRRPTAPNGADPSAGLRREVDRLPDPQVPAHEPSD
jgi:hypothetical protein